MSALHGVVSREMWQDLWPNLPAWEVPITHVTNGVHLRSWVNGDLVQLYHIKLILDLLGCQRTQHQLDTIGLALSLKPAGKVDRITEATIVKSLIASHVSDHNATGVESYSNVNGQQSFLGKSIIELLEMS